MCKIYVLCSILIFHTVSSQFDESVTRLFCPFGPKSRIGDNTTDMYQLKYAAVGEKLLLPCCQKFKTTNNVWFFRNRFFTNQETNFSYFGQWTPLNEWAILMIGETDTGAYYCKEKWSTTTAGTYVYLIDVEYPNRHSLRGGVETFNTYMTTYINPLSSYLRYSNDPDLMNLYKRTGLGLKVGIRWEPWSECDYCKGEKIRKGRCHFEPYVLNENLCIGLCEMYKFSLHMDCQANWTISKMFPLLAKRAKDVPNIEAVAKCVGSCQNTIHLGHDYVKKLRNRIINVGTNLVMDCPGYNYKNNCYWRRNGIKLSSDEYDPERKVSVNDFCHIYLTQVTKEESGNYTCYINDVMTQQNKVMIEEIYWKKNEAWWRHIKYLLYIVLICFVILIGGIAIGCVQRENFKKIKPEELLEMYSKQKFEHERLLPSSSEDE